MVQENSQAVGVFIQPLLLVDTCSDWMQPVSVCSSSSLFDPPNPQFSLRISSQRLYKAKFIFKMPFSSYRAEGKMI